MLKWEEGSCAESEARHLEEKCSICSPTWQKSCNEEPSKDEGKEENSLAIVPLQKMEVSSSSVSLLLKEFSEVKPGWPLLRQAMMSNTSSSHNHKARQNQISVVQWALRLPSRYYLYIESSSRKNHDSNHDQDQSSKLDGETGAIVPVGNEAASFPSSPVSRSLPEELEGLHEKYSATCRLFEFEELKLATSDFTPGCYQISYLVTSFVVQLLVLLFV